MFGRCVGSAHLINIPTNFSVVGVDGCDDFFFIMSAMIFWGKAIRS